MQRKEIKSIIKGAKGKERMEMKAPVYKPTAVAKAMAKAKKK